MGKERALRVWEEFQIGALVECPGPWVVSAEDRAAWVRLTGDPLPRYGDGEGRVHPLLVFSLAHGMVARGVRAAVRQELGISALVAHRVVQVGAALHTSCRVIGAREDADKRTGVLWVRVAVRDRRGVVLSYVAWFRVEKRHRQGKGPPRTRPSVPDGIVPGELHTAGLTGTHDTGGAYVFDDYLPGETLFHGSATVVDATEIRAFARWHRDDRDIHHLPTVAGFRAPLGQVVGIAYALAHDGLRNRMGVGAINALRTPHPVGVGEVLRAMSVVVAKEALNEEVGAVRLRTYLFKDRVPMTDDPPLITDGKRYYEHIALDMDYWELVPMVGGSGG